MSWKGKCTNEVEMAEHHELETILKNWEIWCWCCWKHTEKVDGANNVFRTFYISFSNKIQWSDFFSIVYINKFSAYEISLRCMHLTWLC